MALSPRPHRRRRAPPSAVADSARGGNEILEMQETAAADRHRAAAAAQVKESILHRKYVIPFVLACIILACNQLTGVNSVIGYNATI